MRKLLTWLARCYIRRRLPNKRRSENLKFEHRGHKWFATISPMSDGEPGEVFLSTAKEGDLIRYLASDAAVCASLALQHGCPAKELRAALMRDTGGEPHTPLAAALDLYVVGKVESEDGIVRETHAILKERQ